MTDTELNDMLASPKADHVPILVRELRDCQAKLITTWVCCDGCHKGYRSRDLRNGLCIDCWRTLAAASDVLGVAPGRLAELVNAEMERQKKEVQS